MRFSIKQAKDIPRHLYRGDGIVLFCTFALLFIFAILSSPPFSTTTRRFEPTHAKEDQGIHMSEDKLLIDINTADEALLIELPGIGKARAEAICEYRRANGSFASIDDVLKVPGIGRKTFDQIKDRITIGNASHGKRD